MANSQEYGLFQLIDLGLLNPTANLSNVDSGLLISSIETTSAQHNADVNTLLRLFAVDTTDYQMEVQQSGSSRNQPLDENGRAIPIKPVAPYTVAFPIQGSGSAWGANYITRVQMTVRDLARTLSNIYRGDLAWVTEHILAQLFANQSYSHTDLVGHGALTIYGLANGDSTLYYSSTTNALATDTHYLATADAIDNTHNPYPTIHDELTEHPSNQGEVVAFIATSLVATTIALDEFHSAQLDPAIRQASTEAILTGTLGLALPLGAVVKGKTDSGVWIVEWPQVPAGYIIAITTSGPRPLARRQWPDATLQGFRLFGERQDYPYNEQQFARWEGYGAFNRLGAVVMRIGNGTYAVPTNYTVPMS